MKKILTLLAIGLQVVASHGGTVVGNVITAGANPAAVPFIRFQPVQPSHSTPYLAYFTNTVVPYPVRANVDKNNNFSQFLVGGFYDTYFGNDATLPPLRILAPLNDTNTWSLNQLAQLAVNASMFGIANVTITNYINVTNADNASINNDYGTNLDLWGNFYGNFSGSGFNITGGNASAIFGSGTVPLKYILTWATNYTYTFTIAVSNAADPNVNGIYQVDGQYPTSSYTYTNTAGNYLYPNYGYWSFFDINDDQLYDNPTPTAASLPPVTGWAAGSDSAPVPTLTIISNVLTATPYVSNITASLIGADPSGAATNAVAQASTNYYTKGSSPFVDNVAAMTDAGGGWMMMSDASAPYHVISTVQPSLEYLYLSAGFGVPVQEVQFATTNTAIIYMFGAGSTNANGMYSWATFSGTRTNVAGIYGTGIYTNTTTGYYLSAITNGTWSGYWVCVSGTNQFMYRNQTGTADPVHTSWFNGSSLHGANPLPIAAYQRLIDFSVNDTGVANVPASALTGESITVTNLAAGGHTNTMTFVNGLLTTNVFQ